MYGGKYLSGEVIVQQKRILVFNHDCASRAKTKRCVLTSDCLQTDANLIIPIITYTARSNNPIYKIDLTGPFS